MRLLCPLFLASVLLLPGCSAVSGVGKLDHSAPRDASVDAEGAQSIRIQAGAGQLDVVGRDALASVQAEGTARTSSQDDLDDVQIEARREGSTVVIETEFPEDRRGRTQLDLTVKMPRRLAADIDDSSGDLSVDNHGGPTLDVTDSSGDLAVETDTAAVSIQDSSGDLELRGGRDTEIDDSSGDVDVQGTGRMEITDSSGDIALRDLGGDLTLRDSSGDIRVEIVDGNAEVTDSSGDVRLTDVTGSVTIVEDSSGDIIVKRVGGDFTVEEDGSGDIEYDDVEGDVSIPDGD